VGGTCVAAPPPGFVEPDPGVCEFRTYGGWLVEGKPQKVNHLKSKLVTARSAAEKLTEQANQTRRRQAETVVDIVGRRQRPRGRAIVLGDMNDTPDAAPIEAFASTYVNALTTPKERGGSPSSAPRRRPRRPGRTGTRSRAASTTSSSTTSG
jgi:hypothetical protein